MTARYWVLASDELMRSDPQWPDGLRVTGETAFALEPGMSWYRFEDDNALPSYENREVELTFRTDDGEVSIAERRVTG